MRTLGRRLRISIAAILFVLAVTGPAVAEAPVNSYLGVAIYGYDAVAYFRQGKPVRGSYRYGYMWSGALWLFLTPQNQANFMVNPERYAPLDFEVEGNTEAPDDSRATAELGSRLSASLEGLTEIERVCFVLKHLEQWRIREIAAELGTNDGSVKQALFRAVRKLRVSLADLRSQHDE